MTLFLSSTNLLEWHAELRKTVYLLGYWFVIKGTIQEQPDGRDVQGELCG